MFSSSNVSIGSKNDGNMQEEANSFRSKAGTYLVYDGKLFVYVEFKIKEERNIRFSFNDYDSHSSQLFILLFQ